jgi:hypothetical protein
MGETSWRKLYILQTISLAMFLCFIPVVGVATRWLGPHSFLPAALIHGAIWLNQDCR